MLLQHRVPLRPVIVAHQHGDLVETHAGGLAAEDHRDAYEVVIAIEPSIRAVALWLEQSDSLPMAEHVCFQAESGRSFTDGAQI